MSDKMTCIHRHTCNWGCVINCSEYEQDLDASRNIQLALGISDNWLTIKETAALYGETVACKWLTPDGSDWIKKEMTVNAAFLREMEQNSIKEVYCIR